MPKLSITDFGWDGRGVARLENGRVAMVAGAVPGDEVYVKITEEPRKGVVSAETEQIIAPSQHRVEHPCPHYQEGCPGCALGVVTPEFGAAWKHEHLFQTLRRIGKLEAPEVADTVSSESPWRYRNRIELTLKYAGGTWIMGYQSMRGIVPVHDCHLAELPVATTLATMQRSLRKRGPSLYVPKGIKLRLLIRANGRGGAVGILFVEGERKFKLEPLRLWMHSGEFEGWEIRHTPSMASRYFASHVIANEGTTELTAMIGEKQLPLLSTAFIQANAATAARLVNEALKLVPESSRLIDLYGGFGAFGLAHAQRGGRAVVVESATEAVKAGKRFAEAEKLDVTFLVKDLEKRFDLVEMCQSGDVLLLDPPRSGAPKDLLKQINESGIEKIIYVSCHPAALARDIGVLACYEAVSFTPFDMFPGTPDVETLALLEKKAK